MRNEDVLVHNYLLNINYIKFITQLNKNKYITNNYES